MKKQLRNLRAFTLVEMLLSSVITIILIGSITYFFLNISISKQRYIARQELNYSLQFSIQQITENIKEASSINELESIFDNQSGKLVLFHKNPENSPIIISSSNKQLFLKKGDSESIPLISSRIQLTALSFSQDSSGSISGEITLQSPTNDNILSTENFYASLRSKGSTGS